MKSLSCETPVWNALATASVIMAKKMALTRRLNRPMSSDSTSDTSNAATTPRPTAAQPSPSRVLAIATP